jgi:hypothetical protein
VGRHPLRSEAQLRRTNGLPVVCAPGRHGQSAVGAESLTGVGMSTDAM